jgi:DNA-binding LacI/PurR family transcriptional regulator
MVDAGLTVKESHLFEVRHPPNTSRVERFRIYTEYLTDHPVAGDMTALFCMDDSLAMCFLQAIQHTNQIDKNSLAIIGVNNFPICDVLSPTLTSVEIPFFKDGIKIIETLNMIITHDPGPIHLHSAIRIVPRESA